MLSGSCSKSIIMVTVLLLGGCGMLCSIDEEISVDQLPDHIRRLAEAQVGSNKIVEVERESKDGRIIYAIKYEMEGIEWELEYSESGELLSHERE